jgi:hypothetical protein
MNTINKNKIYKMKKHILSILFLILLGQSPAFAQCSLSATELATNGGFETCTTCGTTLGTGEYTDYSPDYSPTDCSPPGIGSGKFAITKNASSCFGCWMGAGTAGGTVRSGQYAMMVDASTNPRIWCQTITVDLGSSYEFSAYYQNAVTSSCGSGSIPSLQLTVDGTPISGDAAVVAYLGGWDQNKCIYTPGSGSGTVSKTFCVEIYNATSGGSDILIDDISIKKITGGSCTAGTCTFTGPTPVELLSFTANRDGNRAALQWITASEQNSSYFSVEKSDDAIHFTEIGSVNARGNSSNLITYEYEDRQFNSTSYYRLKMLDKDGSYKYSRTAVLKNDEYVRIINHSGEGQLEIKALVGEDTQWNLAIYSLLGQEYLNEKVGLVKGENMIMKKISGGEQSAKIVRITGKDGSVIFSGVVVW